MSGWAGFWLFLGLFCLGCGIENGLQSVARALRNSKPGASVRDGLDEGY